MEINARGIEVMPWEDDHFFSVEEYDEVTGCWYGLETCGTRGEVDDAIIQIRRQEQSRDLALGWRFHSPSHLRVVETRIEYII